MDTRIVERLTKDTISEATLKNSTAEATLTSKIHQGNKATFFNILLLGWSIDTRRIPTTIVSGILAYRRPSTASKSNLVTASCHERLKCGWMWNSLLRMCTVSHFLHLLPHPSNFKPYAESNWSSTGLLGVMIVSVDTQWLDPEDSTASVLVGNLSTNCLALREDAACHLCDHCSCRHLRILMGVRCEEKLWKRPPIALCTITNNSSVLLGPSDSHTFLIEGNTIMQHWAQYGGSRTPICIARKRTPQQTQQTYK